MKRRNFLQLCQVASALALSANITSIFAKNKVNPNLIKNTNTNANANKLPNVVVIGGGFAGATAAKYLRLLSDNKINVTLIEPRPHFISCPMSNRVISGDLNIEDITLSYDTLVKKYAIRLVQDKVAAINANTNSIGGKVKLASGQSIAYDKLIVAPGIDFLFDKIAGYTNNTIDIADLSRFNNKPLHAWKAGIETLALRQQLLNLRQGENFIISIPLAPYRCPPGPYERACLVASYLKQNKSNNANKVIILDANPDVVSKPALFKKIWQEQYQDIIEYHSNLNVVEIQGNKVSNEVGESFIGGVLNIIPPMQAGLVAINNGLVSSGKNWCDIDYVTFESKLIKDIHVIGDAALSSPKVPKSGHIANQQGKYCAYAIVQILNNQQVLDPMFNNTCYSFANSAEAGHIAAVYKYNAEDKNMAVVANSSGVSPNVSIIEGQYASAWAKSIWLDTLG
jgi:sulfide dehydrogenase [flavocytochrome c] flavoprotein chain